MKKALFVSVFLFLLSVEPPALFDLPDPLVFFPKTGRRTASETLIHSHNDYEHERPLLDAIANRFDSVEADIRFSRGRIIVSHTPWDDRGDLKELYLDPLNARVLERGSVYGDGKPFFLWLDIKRSHPKLAESLHALLSEYPIFTTFTDLETAQKPVTVILTGNSVEKNKYVKDFALRKACRDNSVFAFDDPRADGRWLWYALNWNDYFSWDGTGIIAQDQIRRLNALVAAIHHKGRKLRFWSTPQTEAFWRTAISAEVDQIGTDSLERLRDFVSRDSRRASPRNAASQ